MKIYQLVFSLSYGDAIGNDVLSMDEIIKKRGFDTNIMACIIDKRIKNRAIYYDKSSINDDDIVIFHKASGDIISEDFKDMKCKKIMIYHNITPQEHFRYYSKIKASRLQKGIEQVKNMNKFIDYCGAVSEFNALDLISYGYDKDKISIVPILLKYEDYRKEYCKETYEKYSSSKEGADILFLGRITPNKSQEDVIKVFYYYKNFIDKKARLFLVGSYSGCEQYYAKLKGFVKDLKLQDVYFTGHISFEKMLSYYRLADVFLCMSKHEGFCVPLIESMYFDIPIVACDSSAITETLGGSGVLLENRDYTLYSDKIARLMQDQEYRESILKKQRERLEFFSYENTTKIFEEFLDKILAL